ncbi:hypothetical protein NLS1_38700 [Nocardioides sp. LS1]|nr:hypothetical protein NLS1_38700 [Nocardioides sp. LS1]
MNALGVAIVLGDGVPAKCTRMNDDGALPTCVQGPDGQWHAEYPDSGMPGGGGFALLFVLAVIGGVAATAWKVSTARRMAPGAGMDEGDATAMTLLTDDGLEATYLASSLRGTPTTAPVVSAEPAATAPDAASRLRQLESLRDQGLVTPEEYADRRARILDAL